MLVRVCAGEQQSGTHHRIATAAPRPSWLGWNWNQVPPVSTHSYTRHTTRPAPPHSLPPPRNELQEVRVQRVGGQRLARLRVAVRGGGLHS